MNGEAFGLVKRGYRFQISREMLFPTTGPELTKIETPKTAEWLAEREEFLAYYAEWTENGIRNGFLDREPCYECGGELLPTTNITDVRWEDAK